MKSTVMKQYKDKLIDRNLIELAHAVLAKLLRSNHDIWLLKYVYLGGVITKSDSDFFVIPFISVAAPLLNGLAAI